MYNIVTVTFKDSNTATANGVRQWDYGQILRIQGLQLPTAVEVHFALIDSKDSVTRIGTTKDGVTDVVIPDSMIEAGKNIFAYVYLRDSESGQTEYEIKIVVTTRAKPEAFDTPEDKELFAQAIEAVNEAADRAEKAGQAAAGHRTAVEEMKNSVEQTASTFPQKVQEGVQAIENAGASEVQEITQAGTAQKTAVEAAGTQAVESVENVQQVATEAVETAKTEAVQAVQAEGAKQIKEVQDKGAEVLQSIPEDFTTQMETKLDKQQGIENKGKALVIGEDGNVVPGEVASGGGDGIAIINTMSGESPLVIPDSAERVNKRLELGGKTEQVQTSGKNLANPSEFVIGTIAGDTGNIINLKQYITTGYIPVIPGKRYSTSCGNKFLAHAITAYDKEKTKINYPMNMSSEMPEGAAYIRLSYKKIDMANVTESDMEELKKVCMVNEGSTVLPYEPYTGGKPSPSPEYPQEIKSVGKWNEEKQKYEVDVQVCNSGYLQKGSYADKIRAFPLEKGKTYRIRVNRNSAVVNAFILNEEKAFKNSAELYTTCNHAGLTNVNDTGIVEGKCKIPQLLYSGYTFTVTVGGLFLYQGVNNSHLNTDDAYVVYDFIKTVNENQPYVEQTLTITSDRPLTKWDRLVEQGGQIGWLYGSVIATIDETADISLYAPNGFYIHVKNIDKKEKTGYCDKLYTKKMSNGEPFVLFGLANNNFLYTLNTQEFYGKTASEIKAKLKEYPLNIIGKSETTEFIPLQQSEQNAIRALKTYYPTTVIRVDGGELDPDIKVTYTADTKNYIDGKVSAKVASILRQYQADTANLLSLMPMETQATMIENDTNNILNNLESEEAHE